MRSTPTQTLLADAYDKGYAVPAFNASTIVELQAITDAASSLRAPVIIQLSPPQIRLSDIGADEFVQYVRAVTARHEGVYSVHLDHGESYEDCLLAIHAGFDSVMYDGSTTPVEDNAAVTSQVARVCHALGLAVEAELGVLTAEVSQEEDAGSQPVNDTRSERGAHLTSPQSVADFLARSQADSLAVSIGNAHGLSENQTLDLDLLSDIAPAAGIPLVLHGGSGVSDAMITEVRRRGIAKINFFSEVDHAAREALERHLAANPSHPLMMAVEDVRRSMTGVIASKIEACGAAGRLPYPA